MSNSRDQSAGNGSEMAANKSNENNVEDSKFSSFASHVLWMGSKIE